MGHLQSLKKRRLEETDHPNITPMMNLMVVLIPLLLTSAEFVKLGVIELNLPPAAEGQMSSQVSRMPLETVTKLDLTVTITDRGFFISSALAVLSGEQEGEPTIPLKNGSYDFEGLTRKLVEIKERAGQRFPDMEQIIIMAEPTVDYQTVVSTMDASRSARIDNGVRVLFPDVSLSATIQ